MKIETMLDVEGMVAGKAGPVHLALRLTAPAGGAGRERAVAFGLVLDRSGSMGGEKLAQARAAAQLVVKNLRKDDRFGLVLFDDRALTLLPLEVVVDREAAKRAIGRVEAGGSTNLAGGWMLGRDQLKSGPEGYPRKLLLLTDGMLNVGITDPEQVRQLVAQGREAHGIRTSTLGFGPDYQEDLLAGLAAATGGAFYDANDPEKLPTIFEAELEGLQKLVVQNLRVLVRLGDFCEGAGLLSDYPLTRHADGRVEVTVGDLVSEETRTLVVALQVLAIPPLADGTPAADLTGEKLLEAEFRWEEVGEQVVVSQTEHRVIRILPVQNEGEVRRNTEIIPLVAAQRAGRAVREVVREADRGELEQAQEKLRQTILELENYGVGTDLSDALGLLHRTLQDLQAGGGLVAQSRKRAIYASASMARMSSHEYHAGTMESMPSFKVAESRKWREREEARKRAQEGEAR